MKLTPLERSKINLKSKNKFKKEKLLQRTHMTREQGFGILLIPTCIVMYKRLGIILYQIEGD